MLIEFCHNTQSWHYVLLEFKNKFDAFTSHINFISKHYDKCKFALNFIQHVTIPNLFSLEVAQNASIGIFMYYRKTRMLETLKLLDGILERID